MGLRVMVSSNAVFARTGYGTQAKTIIPRLFALGHTVGLFAWYGLEGGALNYVVEHKGKTYPMMMYPKGAHGFGNDLVGQHATRAFQADIIISLIDAWVLDAAAHSPAGVAFVPLFPIDMDPIPPPVLAVVKDSFQPIVYSRFGERMARNAGLDVRYVPHCVDTEVFSPGSQSEAREAMGWPADAFIVGMVAANKGYPSRKCFPEQIKAFARFAEKHDDAFLYLHTSDGENDGYGGVNLPELCRAEGIAERLLPLDRYVYRMGYSDEKMVSAYRGMDVLTNVSLGEGFGIPILEAQSCGTPVLVGDWTSMSELCFAGYKVPLPGVSVPGYGFVRQDTYQPLAANQFTPMIGHLIEGYEWAYANKGNAELRAEARNGALAYDADLVAELYWRPVLDEIADRLGKPRAEPVEALELIEQVAA